MALESGKLKLVCIAIQRIKEHGVESNIVQLGNRENRHEAVTFEEYKAESEFVVGREYEINIGIACNG